MRIDVRQEPTTALDAYARVQIAFQVERVLDVEETGAGPGEFALRERALQRPYRKDYDAGPDGGPLSWGRTFDLSRWAVFSAWSDGRRVGGAAVAFDTPTVTMLEGRDDLAVLWDIRVAPDVRGRGVGSALFRAAERWAETKGCRQLKVETQTVNVAACRFYARHGCVLGAAHRSAYPDHPDEVQLLFYKDLSRGASDRNGSAPS